MNNLKTKFGRFVPAVLVAAMLASANAQAALIAYDSGTGAITWDTTTVVNPLVSAVLAGVVGVTTIFVIILGIKLIFRFFKRAG